ncbi:BtpA/SgcQ family protein [Natrarchaeobaculum aegyptiacum]|uniref:Phosphorybosylanthranilate isomerase n=1 Tax=Natrarchaeobaculum aegyptiacum TaxID=745377 RepID=A0A2Z2HW62_9EURY|nr:BtpA/SgcQ family protein [Natrarchaeobaculum aegyptiacum]ARS91481.1 phosphorybosylanthranilate isomerase [Natrarchaeobaculum aegyptiacum]
MVSSHGVGLTLADDPPIVGMVHLPPLPGAPGFDGDREAIRERALEDARRLEAGGVDAVLVENFGDAPFYPEDVPKHTVAELTAVASAVSDAVDVPVGVNVLRNDVAAALSVAAAVDAGFVRANVHVGTAATDQGVVDGRAHETIRLRERLEADLAVLADVHVKHATPVGDQPVERAALESVERGLSDGVIVSGTGTGEATALETVERVSEAFDTNGIDAPVFVGSGVTAETVGDVFEAGADGVIVGTALKEGGETTNPVSIERVEGVVAARDPGAGDY